MSLWRDPQLEQRFVRTLWLLDRDLAYARHYPALAWSGSFARDTGALSSWYAGKGDPGWAARRARVADLLGEADRLGALADLMGLGALPGHERVVLLAGRLLREGLLQQSALSAVDAVSSPTRTALLTTMLLDVVQACEDVVGEGVPPASVEELDLTPVLRAREEVAGEDPAAFAARRDEVLARLRALGRP
ncbi:MAG: ATP synthase beta subunit C-terminal domain-containing protein [Mycobacteriales bacterium]